MTTHGPNLDCILIPLDWLWRDASTCLFPMFFTIWRNTLHGDCAACDCVASSKLFIFASTRCLLKPWWPVAHLCCCALFSVGTWSLGPMPCGNRLMCWTTAWCASAKRWSPWGVAPITRSRRAASRPAFLVTITKRRDIWSQNDRRKFRSQTSDIMDSWKIRGGKSQRGEEKKREDQRGERVRRKKMQVREKVGKSRFTVFFPMICGSGGSKSRLAKAAGAEPCGQMWHEKLHAAVARSTFGSKKAKDTSRLEHVCKLRCRKSARRCGAKHISNSNMYKTPHARTTFDASYVFLWQAQGIVHLFKSVQNVGFCSSFN